MVELFTRHYLTRALHTLYVVMVHNHIHYQGIDIFLQNSSLIFFIISGIELFLSCSNLYRATLVYQIESFLSFNHLQSQSGCNISLVVLQRAPAM